ASMRANDRERLLATLLEPVEIDEDDRELAARLLTEKTPEDIAALLVRAHRAAMPQPEELIQQTPEARRQAQVEKHRPGFEDIVWFRMDIGRRQNADARWILPLICRRGHVTKNEIGAIRIGPNETSFQIPRAIAAKFQAAISRTAEGDDDVRIEQSDGPPESGPRPAPRQTLQRAPGGPGDGPRPHRTGNARGNEGRPAPRHHAKPYQKGPRPR
ncbi:MAG: DEAD/DEAH box helicase, partial [Sphingomonadales bacterium]